MTKSKTRKNSTSPSVSSNASPRNKSDVASKSVINAGSSTTDVVPPVPSLHTPTSMSDPPTNFDALAPLLPSLLPRSTTRVSSPNASAIPVTGRTTTTETTSPFFMLNQFSHLPIDPIQSTQPCDESDSSESSQNSDEDDINDSSSESSNSSHESESEEEEEVEEEDGEEESEESDDDSLQPPLSPSSAMSCSPLQILKNRRAKKEARKNLTLKHVQKIQDGQRHMKQTTVEPGSPKTQGKTLQSKEEDKEPVVLLIDQSAQEKRANFSVRTLWTLIMIGGFFACVAAGPLFVILLVVSVQGLVYKEVIYLANVPSREKKLPWFRSLNWYFLFSTNYFLYGESLIHNFQHIFFVDAFLLPFATHHRFISFSLYVIGFVFFVANLKKGHYRFQFSQFAWTHMTLLLVVCQSHFIINNIFEGLIWFFLPASLVVTNDIWAYIFGFFMGKTPLIKLSPKKTVEGFVGGWIMTMFFGILFATLFLKYPYMICPVKDLRATAFSGLTCEPNPVFVPTKHFLTPWLASLGRHLGMRHNYVMVAPLQWHVLIMACFASLIAPFGGFFASGFKRAFKIKDFGQSIPGHGGITDRMDCQFLMGLFSYMYYQSFIKTSALSVGLVLQTAINHLDGAEQMELFVHMRRYLIGQGLLDDESCVVMPPKEAWIS
ncbi:hypothetical protein BGZ94_009246 [Podila epigama]|nr:hypothetical protein BGZ94_009246 [Podila epigama]